ncbi:early nodulin-75-like isoform X1 [Neodiprion virginianus]|uniref:early nodulin-75-like isoform X1 n=1 Tax=Neodiprion virginianus TaxID=2961670 RepID=UPI001EE6EE53|nr:early nodulin-75-like isoform X1 [Neodiprion virginianus]
MRFVLILVAVLTISSYAGAQIILGTFGLKNLIHGRDRHTDRRSDDRRNGLLPNILTVKRVITHDRNHGRNDHNRHHMQSDNHPDRRYSNLCPCPIDSPGNQWTHQRPPPSQYPEQYYNDYDQGMKGHYSNQFYDDWNGQQRPGPRPPPPSPHHHGPPPPPSPYNRPGPPPRPDYIRPRPEPQPNYNRPGPWPQPDYNRPGPEPQSNYNRPGPEPQPNYNRSGSEPQPDYNRPGSEPQPDYNRPGPEPQPSYNRPGPEPQPSYNRPGPEPQPSYNRPDPEPQPDYNKPELSTPRPPAPSPSSNGVTADKTEIAGATTETSTAVEFIKEPHTPSISLENPEPFTELEVSSSSSVGPEPSVDHTNGSEKGATESSVQSQSTTEFDWNNYFPQVSVDNPGGAGVIDIRGDFR